MKQNGESKEKWKIHLVPKTKFYQLKLPRNCDVPEVFLGLKDKLGELEPKKNIALKIYEQICPIYGKGPFPMKKKQNCLQNILKLYDDYQLNRRKSNFVNVESNIFTSWSVHEGKKLCQISFSLIIFMKESSF